MWDLDAALTMQGLAAVRGDSPVTIKTDDFWDLSNPLGYFFCILY